MRKSVPPLNGPPCKNLTSIQFLLNNCNLVDSIGIKIYTSQGNFPGVLVGVAKALVTGNGRPGLSTDSCWGIKYLENLTAIQFLLDHGNFINPIAIDIYTG